MIRKGVSKNFLVYFSAVSLFTLGACQSTWKKYGFNDSEVESWKVQGFSDDQLVDLR